jgi:hypothetical protein
MADSFSKKENFKKKFKNKKKKRSEEKSVKRTITKEKFEQMFSYVDELAELPTLHPKKETKSLWKTSN